MFLGVLRLTYHSPITVARITWHVFVDTRKCASMTIASFRFRPIFLGRAKMFAKEKRCSKCGEEFECGGLLGCCCRDVKLDAATLVKLRGTYADCLCPPC